ncbi:MAG: rod-binding protein [Planctomycetales bacterium]|nr:rod-binding protein [Planctomycetales bacterium]
MDAIGNSIGMALPGQIAAAQSALGSAGIAGADPSLQQIKELGTEFESVFMSMLLKEMRNSLDEGFFGGEGSDSFGGMFDLFIGQHLAKSNAIGVSDLLVQQYAKANANSEGDQNQNAASENQSENMPMTGVSISA